MLNEFKKFIARGNVLDMAVGIIVGSAFTAIVNSLVNDIFTPLMGLLLGGIDFSGLSIKVGEATIAYGSFIQAIINFLLIAFSVFILIKMMNKIPRKKEEEKVPTTKKCPYCKSDIAIDAVKCPHCTSDIEE